MDTNSTWAIFYAGLVGMKLHPGHKLKPEDIRAELQLCGYIADAMLDEYTKRVKEHEKCHSSCQD